MTTSIFDLLGIIADFEETLNINDINESRSNNREKIVSHLQKMDKIYFKVPEFTPDLEWLNVSQPLKMYDHLKGKIVVLDFFTYCCINCMHILPDLKLVEERYPLDAGVVIVGVHSAKFLNERVTSNILSAILRYNIQHPVVNDKNATLWQELAVSCWPTLIFLGPKGQIIHSIAGEGHRDKLLLFLDVATQYYSSELQPSDLPISLSKNEATLSQLIYPGKICYWPERHQLVIADTGNHRIIVTDVNGIVQNIIGNGHKGLKDGRLEIAEFSSPQGVTCDSQNIFVADTENHCIRKISFESFEVKTISGTGHQGSDKIGGNVFQSQALSSPWDVLIGYTPDGTTSLLFIAMAGSHQIWVYFLNDTLWYSKSYVSGTCLCFAGSGQEENRNNSYPDKASFAQPSGLALSMEDSKGKLYIADSESSSVRYISLSDGKVCGLVGGERDPTNLFAFGDTDGIGINAKLQHPLGVAVLDEQLIIADSYNHKIKTVDLKTLRCETLAGTGQPGSSLFASDFKKSEFNEPGGVCVNAKDKLIYIADTNNHDIKVIDLKDGTIFKLPIIFSSAKEEEEKKNVTSAVCETTESDLISLPDVVLTHEMTSVTLRLPLGLAEDEHLNALAPNTWLLSGMDEESDTFVSLLDKSKIKGRLDDFLYNATSGLASVTLQLPLSAANGKLTLKISVHVFVCNSKSNMCLPPKWVFFKQVVRH
uniref:Thioredoxin domain-containing protein n=1 Tax=Biomphalaria glabrata TaxID=6526 RepID=A0A2C9JRW6_BIOGL